MQKIVWCNFFLIRKLLGQLENKLLKSAIESTQYFEFVNFCRIHVIFEGNVQNPERLGQSSKQGHIITLGASHFSSFDNLKKSWMCRQWTSGTCSATNLQLTKIIPNLLLCTRLIYYCVLWQWQIQKYILRPVAQIFYKNFF